MDVKTEMTAHAGHTDDGSGPHMKSEVKAQSTLFRETILLISQDDLGVTLCASIRILFLSARTGSVNQVNTTVRYRFFSSHT